MAPIPLCIYAVEASSVSTACAGFIAYLIGAANQAGYLPLPIFLFVSIVNAAMFAFVLLMFRYAAMRGNHWISCFVFASGWTAYEFITSVYSSYGTFHSLAYTQIANLPIIQITSITGIWGVTFLVTLIPACLAIIWYYRYNRSIKFQAGIMPCCLLVITLLFGCYRLNVPAEGPTVTIGIAAMPTTIERLLSNDAQQVWNTIEQYGRSIELLARSGAKVVVLPEKLARLTPPDKDPILQYLADIACQNGITLIAGFTDRDKAVYNSAYVFSPDGKLLLKYDKQHLLPAYEGDYTPGNTLGIVKTQSTGTWGIEICKDMDFVQPSRQYSQQGINMIFTPALDFHADGWLHARVAIMRGVEGNYAVARAAQWGLLTISDNKGRIIATASADANPNETLLIGELNLGAGKSIYSKLGDWFGWACIIFYAYSLLFLFFPKEKETDSISPHR